ncbi:Hcp family type VI secretion system effector [Rahnella variigena]|uniref:Hcp family type VI secretion system effector n=1 Tax=Rahnella variigena TaxID=574964 RepID=UPI0013306890|nr:type VI secretion system tube protein TssD [Rahnella variigena]
MSVPAYLWLYDSNGVLIQGGSEILGSEGAIEIQSFTHGLSVPFDGNTGRLMSTRVHQTMGLVKEFDKSTPYLYRAVATSEKLQKAVVKWYRINAAGMEEEYLNMTMEGVRLLNINPHMHNFKHAEGQASIPTESIGLGYHKITWLYLDGHISFTDEWNSSLYA